MLQRRSLIMSQDVAAGSLFLCRPSMARSFSAGHCSSQIPCVTAIINVLFTNSIVWTLTTSLNEFHQASASASGPGAFACGAHFVQWICLPDHSGVYRSLVQRVTPVEGVRLFAFRIS